MAEVFGARGLMDYFICNFCSMATSSEIQDQAGQVALQGGNFNFRFCKCKEGEKALEKWRLEGSSGGIAIAHRVTTFLPAAVRFQARWKQLLYRFMEWLARG